MAKANYDPAERKQGKEKKNVVLLALLLDDGWV